MASGGFFSGPKLLEAFKPTIQALAEMSGYTFFAVQHGPQPDFVVAEIYPQIARAVRFIRLNARRFGVDPDHLGIMGFSSGGYLSLMRGVTGDDGNPKSADPVERASSRVQAVVAFFPPTDFLNYGTSGTLDVGTGVLKDFRLAFVHQAKLPKDEKAMGRSISPIYKVTKDDAPTLLIHGDQDSLVPIQQSQIFQAALRKAGVECALRVKKGANHGWNDMQPDLNATVEWFNRHLAVTPSPSPNAK